MDRKLKLRIKAKLVATPGFLAVASWFTRHTPKIFMLHRFTHEQRDAGAVISAENFARQLQVLRDGPWQVVALRDYLQLRVEKRKIPPYLVVLTIDDGYRDFYDVAYPLLRQDNLPATFFVTTEFVEGKFWLWHDRIYYVLAQTKKKDFSFRLDGQERWFSLADAAARCKTWKVFSDYCIQVRDEAKWEVIASLESTLEVILPEAPPDEYAAVSWEQLQELAENNIEIGSHTCSHPILSKIDTAKLEVEIALSKKIITGKLHRPVLSFCYPNGHKDDFNNQVIECIERAGYLGAVQGFIQDFGPLCRLPRLGIGNDFLDFNWKLCGLELLLNKHK